MHRILITAALIIWSGTQINAQTAKPDTQPNKLEELKLDTKPLAQWGTRLYSYQVKRGGNIQTLGTVSLTTKVLKDKIVFKDNWNLLWHGKTIKFGLEMQCHPDSLLRPETISSKGEGDEVASYSVTISNGKATVNMKGKDRTIDFPADTLTDAAMFRIFTLLPRKKGFVAKVGHIMEVSELNLKKDGTIVYYGPETIQLNAKEVTLHKYIYKQGSRDVEEAWVDDKGRLRRIRIDGRKILTEKQSDK